MIRQRSLLVPADIDRADILEAEVPLELWLHKRRHKPATGSIHMDLHIITLQASFHLVQGVHQQFAPTPSCLCFREQTLLRNHCDVADVHMNASISKPQEKLQCRFYPLLVYQSAGYP